MFIQWESPKKKRLGYVWVSESDKVHAGQEITENTPPNPCPTPRATEDVLDEFVIE